MVPSSEISLCFKLRAHLNNLFSVFMRQRNVVMEKPAEMKHSIVYIHAKQDGYFRKLKKHTKESWQISFLVLQPS